MVWHLLIEQSRAQLLMDEVMADAISSIRNSCIWCSIHKFMCILECPFHPVHSGALQSIT